MTDSLIEKRYLPAALEALKAFPIQLEDIQAIRHSENVTFRIIPRDSATHYALRLHRHGYNSLAELNSERQWTRALKESGLAVPESLTTTKGHHFYPVNINATGERCLSGMTTWLEGIPLNEYLPGCTELKVREQIYRQIGAMTEKATINRQAGKNRRAFNGVNSMPMAWLVRTLIADGFGSTAR